MIKKILALIPAVILLFSFSNCDSDDDENSFTQPVIELSAKKETVSVGGTSITIGPEKEYEQGSSVVYKLKITSPSDKLSKITVSTSADALAQTSEVLKTVPADAIDKDGNFIKDLNEVEIYYRYDIHILVPPGYIETVTFTVHDKKNNTGFINQSHSVIKTGSASGKLLNVVDLQYFNKTFSMGIGTQDNLQWGMEGGIRPDRSVLNCRGPLFSLRHSLDYFHSDDAIENAEEVDLVGYRTIQAGTDPVLPNARYNLTSPCDSTLLYYAYVGAIPQQIQLQGASGTVDITVGGVKRTATFTTNINTTATSFVNEYKSDYAAAGLAISASSGKLIWKITVPFSGIENPVVENTSGNLTGVEQTGRDFDKIKYMRETIRAMAVKLKKEGKKLREVRFMRLDNIEGPNKVTPEAFDQLTHDNEFDTLLEGIAENGTIRATDVALNQVYGFVMDDGKRGLIRTSQPQISDINGVLVNVPNPYASNMNLYGVIKYQKPE